MHVTSPAADTASWCTCTECVLRKVSQHQSVRVLDRVKHGLSCLGPQTAAGAPPTGAARQLHSSRIFRSVMLCTISPAKPPTSASVAAAPASTPGAPCAPGRPVWLLPAVPTPARPAAASCLGGEPVHSPTGAVPAHQPLAPVSSPASRPPAAGSPGAHLLPACALASCAPAPQQSARLPGSSGPACPARAGEPCGAALCEAVRARAASAATPARRRGNAHGGAGLLPPPPHAASSFQAVYRQQKLDSHHDVMSHIKQA